MGLGPTRCWASRRVSLPDSESRGNWTPGVYPVGSDLQSDAAQPTAALLSYANLRTGKYNLKGSNMPVKYTKERLQLAAKCSYSVLEVIRRLGANDTSGGVHSYISRQLELLGIDTSHFLGLRRGAGKSTKTKTPPNEVLVRQSGRVRGSQLRAALLAIGRPELCALCGCGPIWNTKPLKLHVDHTSGDRSDCRPENVRFLCPNCHSQTPTYAIAKSCLGKQKPKCRVCGGPLNKSNRSGYCFKCLPGYRVSHHGLPKNKCLACGLPAKHKYCSYKCARLASRRVVWPDNLAELVAKSSRRQVALELGVSDKAVAKHLA